ncbi:Argininosuccinate lyase [Variovorax sp. PBS-H4]|uniref:Bug family tripartite tricarboxylate transporter substrate binding protein n=1 Tax=Variovorax sp. PBS-H4 TaxID=434008 RepID=UPI0013164CDE|nr:tripartite tricarboxylate transporter substrate binding protein [Variovorax sp. PBS-H4]VTU37604.1 Argininosuccinate lyase [Variovorax sp. PBS-H4]
MNIDRTRRAILASGASALGSAAIGWPALTSAQDAAFPTKPVTLIVPFPAGGTADVVYRALARSTEPHLGQTIVIENKPGASATLGASTVALGRPDGYQIAVMHSGVLRLQLMQKTNYNALTDLTPIIQISALDVGILVRADSPYKTFKDYLDDARKRPGQVTYGTNGQATSQNLALITLAAQEGITLNHVPYKGDAEATAALLGGFIDAHAGGTILGALVDGGKARWLAVFSDRRMKKWPDVPTLYDLGYKIPVGSPTGLIGPAHMPPVVVKKLHDAFKAGLAEPLTVSTLERNAMDVYYKDGAAFAALIRQSYELEKERVSRAGLLLKS